MSDEMYPLKGPAWTLPLIGPPLFTEWGRLDDSPAATVQMLTWHAPRTVALLREQIAQEIEDRRKVWAVSHNGAAGMTEAARVARGTTDVAPESVPDSPYRNEWHLVKFDQDDRASGELWPVTFDDTIDETEETK